MWSPGLKRCICKPRIGRCCLLESNLEVLFLQQQVCTQQNHRDAVPEEEYGFNGSPVVHQGFRKKGIQSICDAGDDAGRVAYDGILAKLCHVRIIKRESLRVSKSPRLSGGSGRRGPNPRPSAWKADALPTELLPQFGPFSKGDAKI